MAKFGIFRLWHGNKHTPRMLVACYGLLEASGELMSVPGGIWILAAISLRLLDSCCYFWESYRCWLLFPNGFWMVAVIFHRLLDASCYFLMAFTWLLIFPGAFWLLGSLYLKPQLNSLGSNGPTIECNDKAQATVFISYNNDRASKPHL